ncbi:RNA polymerase factor sigma-54 [Candidatus Hydrogenedentota bacterium]
MDLRLHLSQRQVQKLALTPQMQQAIKMLQLSTIELDTFLRKELQENPLLEEQPSTDVKPTKEEKEELREPERPAIDEIMQEWDEYHDGTRREERRISSYGDPDAKRSFIENTLTEEKSLADHLTEQLNLNVDAEEAIVIGEWIIGEIDENGYFTSTVEAGAEQLGVAAEAVEPVLRTIQAFDPVGVGAASLAECLVIQLQAQGRATPVMKKMLLEHMDLLEKHQYPKLAQALGVSLQEAQELAHSIVTLEPRPGRQFSGGVTQYVVPEVEIKKIDDNYVVIMNGDSTPIVRLSPYYRKLLKSSTVTKETTDYLEQRFNSARWLLKSIEQRKSTIFKVTSTIAELQKDFLDKGPSALKPMTLQQIADKIEMHESTVSRVTTNKYVQTPQGIFELKYFFTSGIESTNGESLSSASVKVRIQELVAKEDKKRPFSDEKLAKVLKSEGLSIARRTVTKYRESMSIPPSKMRRVY